MRLGVALPLQDLAGGPARPRSFADSARAIEELGFESVWTFDAIGRGFMLPGPPVALPKIVDIVVPASSMFTVTAYPPT